MASEYSPLVNIATPLVLRALKTTFPIEACKQLTAPFWVCQCQFINI